MARHLPPTPASQRHRLTTFGPFAPPVALVFLAVAIAAAVVCSSTALRAEDLPGSLTPMPGVTAADLEATLKAGLRTRRPVENDFIKEVVVMVKNKELPIELVQSTFLWARRQKPYQYPYFERALRERAKKLELSVPEGAGY